MERLFQLQRALYDEMLDRRNTKWWYLLHIWFFEGSIHDVSIFKKSGILDFINPVDSILVDKGFTVQELLLPKQATLFIPPFLG